MSLKTLILILIVTLLQSCFSYDEITSRGDANWNLFYNSIDYLGGTSDSVLPPIYAYKRDILNNGFDEDDYNELEQEMILHNHNNG
jgi:hypothetical protein